MPRPHIRPAEPEDLPELRAVYRRASWSNEGDRPLFAEHPELLDFSGTAVHEGRTLVADAGGRIVGFVTLLETGSTAEVEDLFVDPGSMRHGIGRALVEAIAGFAAGRGWARIEVDANPHAEEFYTRTGFEQAGRVPLEHGEAIRMWRTV